MKKFYVFFILLCVGFVFCACSDPYYDLIYDNMSDLRINYFYGSNDNYQVELSCGYREEVFAYDGVSTNSVECGVLSLSFYTAYSYEKITVNLDIDGENSEIVLEKSPFENKYMVDLEKIYTSDNVIKVALKNSDQFVTLNEISKDFKISYKQALEIATNHFSNQLQNLYFNNILHAEGYLKIIKNPEYDNIYWFFSFIDVSNNSQRILIDVNDGRIIEMTIK